MIRLTYAPDLLEEAVLLAERTAQPADARAFRRERDRIYEVADDERREAGFRWLHLRWFTRLALHHPIEQAVAERADIIGRLDEGRVLGALTRGEEGGDLIDQVVLGRADPRPILVLRLRPATLVEPDSLRRLLRHELMHVADMLDPAFGYERTLPHSDDGPSGDNIRRDRYRVLWDVTIDGRLTRTGLADSGAREARSREFATTFAMLGHRRESVFEEWFDRIEPTHACLVAFALAPNGSRSIDTNPADSGRCPLCRFPVASLDPNPERLSAGARAAIGDHHPGWRIEQGLCSQCLDLYEAHCGHQELIGAEHTGDAR